MKKNIIITFLLSLIMYINSYAQNNEPSQRTFTFGGNTQTISSTHDYFKINKFTLGWHWGDEYKISKALKMNQVDISSNLVSSIESLVELRDNSIHFINTSDISNKIQEIGFACVKNYINFIKQNDIEIDLSNYNFYLMPLAYIDSKVNSLGILTNENNNYLEFVKSKLDEKNDNDDYDIAISIEINFKKSNSFDGVPVNYDKSGTPIYLSSEEIDKNFPLSYKYITDKAKQRYTDFKSNSKFNEIMKAIKLNNKLFYERKLDPKSPKSPKKGLYNTNIWQELDKHYTKK